MYASRTKWTYFQHMAIAQGRSGVSLCYVVDGSLCFSASCLHRDWPAIERAITLPQTIDHPEQDPPLLST